MKLTVKDTPPLDGDYEADFDIGRLKNDELRVIKRISGVRAGELQEALKAGDNDLLIAYAVVFLTRAGKDPDMAEQLLWEVPVGSIDFDTTAEELAEQKKLDADARPPDSPTQSGDGNEHDEIGRPSEKTGSSGNGMSQGSVVELTQVSQSGSLR